LSNEKMRKLYLVWKITREDESCVPVRKGLFTALLSRNS